MLVGDLKSAIILGWWFWERFLFTAFWLLHFGSAFFEQRPYSAFGKYLD
jgi:hypothetical protein